MASPLQALLHNLIDYAGLFPPAQLSMEQAWTQYGQHRQEPVSWMLGRFICPASRLKEISPLLAATPEAADPWRFSLLGRGGKEPQEFFANVRADLADAAAFTRQWGSRVAVEVYETRLPVSVFQPMAKNKISSLVATTAFLVDKEGPGPLSRFLEPAHMAEESVLALLECLGEERQRSVAAGLKIRCGGLEAAAFPAVDVLARVLYAAGTLKLPLKATAGLHHPFRHADAAIPTTMHGFVNLLAAACACAQNPPSLNRVKEILADPEKDNFKIAESFFGWKELRWTVDQVAAMRQNFFTSFGSCSFEEPKADLQSAAWL